MNRHHSALSYAIVIFAGSATLLAGPLNPPAGPITSTYKTLTEVEPRIAVNAANTPGTSTGVFRISQPGSYYLAGNVAGLSGKHGIEIASSGVTLDLNGFDLVGVPGSLDGVSVTSSSFTGIAVVNGSVRNWGDKGVEMQGVGNRVERVRAVSNSVAGFGLANGCAATGCNASQNAGAGFVGAFGCSFTDCIAYINTTDGFVTTNIGSTFANCLAHGSGGAGFNVGSGAALVGCSASGCAGNGFTAGITATLSGCSASLNGGHGISVASAGSVIACSSRSNALDGILVTSNATVRDNAVAANGNGGDGANIHAIGTDNRIESNNCTIADRGIDIDSAGNIIARNACSGNTVNWDVAAGNVILVVAATPAAAVLGNSGGTAPGSTDPSANFTY
ncbi:MAG: right-handed parallel beta-helix repeat-containing protein [Dehalococcoidia bacterium]|nr:right-handed parallel beta-helix repeat-containing protein [Dehalococcoidia bacterium]